MDVLSKLLDKAASIQKFGYHPRCKNLSLTHLAFADDLMVLSDGKVRSVEGIVAVFDQFAKYSGLKISMEKSTLYMQGVTEEIRTEIVNRFKFSAGTLPVRYLGLPLTTKSMQSSDYQPLIESLKKRIGSWKNRFLSYAGRLELIGSVLWSTSNFWLSAFRLPSACIKEIDKLCSAFLWSGHDLNHRKSKMAWAEVCRPTDEGGLGLRSLKETNKVTLLKLLWRLVSNTSSLWVRWIKDTLMKNESIWSIKEDNKRGSWMWRKILKVRNLARNFCKVEVHNGEKTSFWYDHWSPMGCLRDVLGPRGQIDMGIGQFDSVKTACTKRRRRNHRSNDLIQIEDHLRMLTRTEEEDIVLWKGKNDVYKAKFTARDTWNHIRVTGGKVSWHKGLWFRQATPKFRFCAWLAMHNRLPTGDRMAMWNSGSDGSCILCHQHLETRSHLFFACSYSSTLWKKLTQNLLGNLYSADWEDIVYHLTQGRISPIHRFLLRYVFQAAVYTIWRERNGRKHGDQSHSEEIIFRMIDRQVKNRIATLRHDKRMATAYQSWIGVVGT